jgi:hypothetical protein
VLYVIEVHEVNEPKALKAVEAAFDWSDLRIYDVNVPGLNTVFFSGLADGRREQTMPVLWS